MQRIANGEDGVVEKNLVLVHAADDVDHDVRLELVEDDPVVVEDDVARLLGRLLDETLLKGLLRLDVGVGIRRRVAGCPWFLNSQPMPFSFCPYQCPSGGEGGGNRDRCVHTVGSGVRRGVVFGEYSRSVLGAQDEDGLHRQEGHSGRHGCGLGGVELSSFMLCCM